MNLDENTATVTSGLAVLRGQIPRQTTSGSPVYFRGQPGFVEPRTVAEQIADYRTHPDSPPHWAVSGVHLACCPCRWIDEPGRVKHDGNSEWPDW